MKFATTSTTAQSLRALLKSAGDIMRKDNGSNGDIDWLPMLTRIMLLKFLDDLLEKCTSDGERQFTLPDVLIVRPMSDHGNVNEVIAKFSSADPFCNAVNQLCPLLYAA